MAWLGLIVIVIVLILLARASAKPKKKPAPSTKPSRESAPGLTISASADRTTVPAARAPESLVRWNGPGSTIKAGGFTITAPCVYTSTNRHASDPSEVLLDADVKPARGPLPELDYWPWYSRLTPQWRHVYLKWLADGKRALPPNDGLLFLYYYGLERRLLVEQQDAAFVLGEIVRLRGLDAPRASTKEGASFRGYSSELIWFTIACAPERFDAKSFQKACELTTRWHESLLPAPLLWLARAAAPLPVSLAREVARLHPDSVRSVVTSRVADQFNELFSKRYREQFGEGLSLKSSKRSRRYAYTPASAAMRPFECSICDPTGAPAQFAPLAAIWNGCVDDLRVLSRRATGSGQSVTVETWEAMPDDLRQDTDHPLAPKVQELVRAARTEPGGEAAEHALIAPGAVASFLGLPSRPRLTATQSRRVASTLHYTGFCVEPDARLTSSAYGWDAQVAVFPRSDDDAVDVKQYGAAACILELGLSIAEADGEVSAQEIERLGEQIDAVFSLSAHERQRLAALREVLLRTGANPTRIAKRLESALAPEARRSVGRMLVAIAAASGAIDRKEQTALRKCFRGLGLPPELLEETIAQITGSADVGLAAVAPAVTGAPGEAIPSPPTLTLNREAISRILSETRDVAKILAEAMAEYGDEETEEGGPTPAGGSDAAAPASVRGATSDSPPPVATRTASATEFVAPSGPPARYATFYEAALGRDRWPIDECQALARTHGLMLAGAIEAINDWALDKAGVPAVEEDGQFIVVTRIES